MIISSLELVIMIKINIPKVCKTICKQTLPCIMLIVWGSELQLPAWLVQICTSSTNLYREAEYPWLKIMLARYIPSNSCVSKCLKLSQVVSKCLKLSQVVSSCLKLSQSVSKYHNVSQSVSKCLRLRDTSI